MDFMKSIEEGLYKEAETSAVAAKFIAMMVAATRARKKGSLTSQGLISELQKAREAAKKSGKK